MRHAGSLSPWRLWIDTGGTFTDCIAVDSRGRLHRTKVLSSSTLRGYIHKRLGSQEFAIEEKWQVPDDFVTGCKLAVLNSKVNPVVVSGYQSVERTIKTSAAIDVRALPAPFEIRIDFEAPILAAHIVTGTPLSMTLPAIDMRLATTRGTNALLERKGAPVALFITRGFKDLLRIGTQQRPDIFALRIVRPEPLYAAVVEVDERTDSEGRVLRALDEDALRGELASLREQGLITAAIAFMHSYLNPTTELKVASMLRAHGFSYVSCSADLSPMIKILPRAETAVVDAYLSPIMDSYLTGVADSIPNGRLHVMTSAGGLVDAGQFRPKDSLLSGPAGGVVGAAISAKRSGFDKVIAFDMGGTSTDVARIDGDFEYVFEHQIGDAHLVGNALAIESVASGGGSICSFDGFKTTVGPESAGAKPGPACYGIGGPLTITDVNLLLGRLDPARFEIPISVSAAKNKLDSILSAIRNATRQRPQREQLLYGFYEIANERMADAIRRVSVRKGYNPADFALVSFGGAGGQHACAIAQRLGIKTIVIPRDASLLSAFGLGHAPIERFAEKQILRPLSGLASDLPKILSELAAEALAAVKSEVGEKVKVIVRRRIVNLRFVGQDSVLTVEYDAGTGLKKLFNDTYRGLYGHLPEGREIEVESVRVVASTDDEQPREKSTVRKEKPATPGRQAVSFFDGAWISIPTFQRESLTPGAMLAGPALVFEQHSTTVVGSDWNCLVDKVGALILTSK
jgi:5-oxoprolinase (ATP-hydrolysing)